MTSLDNKELEKQLVEAGNKLLQLPSSVDEILSLLDQVENYLSRVEQSPSQSMQTALSPSVKALVADELLRHQDTNVKVAVASCISEITRITAPDAPYDDDRMKAIFQLIVSSFENLSDKASRSYDKRTSILETVAKVRSCVLMLDLDCDGLIVEMFQHFLKAIRDDHPDNVFSSMETIMTLVLEESEDISLELISPILDSVKSNNQEVPPIARKLAKRVVENSATKLKPYLIQATKSLGFSLNDYGKAISSIFSGTGAVGCNDGSACVEQSTEESNLARASSDVAVQDESKLAVASPDEAAQDEPTKDSLPKIRPQGDHPAQDKSPNSVVSNYVTEAGYVGRIADRESSKEKMLEQEQEQAHQTGQSADANVTSNGEPDDSNSGKIIKSDSKTEETSKKRRRKKSVNISTDPPDSSRVHSDKEAETTTCHGKSLSKEVHSSTSREPSVEEPGSRENKKEDIHMSSLKELGSKKIDVASPSSSGNVPAEGRSKKVGRSKKNDDLTPGVSTSADVFKKASGGTGGSDGKQQRRSVKKATTGRTIEEATLSLEDKSKKRSGKKATAGRTIEETTPSLEDKSKKRSGKMVTAGLTTDVKAPALTDKCKSEYGSTSDSEDKPLKVCARKVDARDNNGDGSSSKKKEYGKRRIRRKSILKDNLIQSSTKDDDREMVSSPKPALNLAKIEDHLEDTPMTSSKRKRGPVKAKASDALEYGDNLIGLNVKVWWPEDHEFYQGAIVSFDPVRKRHKVVYSDGDEEVLNLKQEKWEVVGPDSVSDAVEQATECPSPDPSNEMYRHKKKAKTNSEPSAKQGKPAGSRGEASSSKSKGAATKSGPKSRVDGKFSDDTSKSGDKTDASGGKSEDCIKKGSHKSIADGSSTDEKSKDDAHTPKTVSKMKLGTQKTHMEDTPKTSSKSKGKATKSVNKSNANGSGKVKETVGKEESPEMVKTPESTDGMSLKGERTATKGGKKRRSGGAKCL